MNTHTPGPWHRNISADGKYPTVFAGRNQHVAVASQQKDSAETEANISLIAAAPDLLDALQDLLDVVGVRIDDPRIVQFDRARAAIAKAGGAA
jgi:hypothetical protein